MWAARAGSSKCEPCPSGAVVIGLNGCVACLPGRYASPILSDRGSNYCAPCGVNHISQEEGAIACTACPEGRFPNANATMCQVLVDSPAPTPLAVPVTSVQRVASGWAVPSANAAPVPHEDGLALKGWSVRVLLLSFGSTAMLWAACAGMCVLQGELTKHKHAIEMQTGAPPDFEYKERQPSNDGPPPLHKTRRMQPAQSAHPAPPALERCSEVSERRGEQQLLLPGAGAAIVRITREPKKKGERTTGGLVAAWSPAQRAVTTHAKY